MPEEHTGQVGFEYAWKELLSRTNSTGSQFIANSSWINTNVSATRPFPKLQFSRVRHDHVQISLEDRHHSDRLRIHDF